MDFFRIVLSLKYLGFSKYFLLYVISNFVVVKDYTLYDSSEAVLSFD